MKKYETFAKLIFNERIKRNLEQPEFAKLINNPQQYLSRWESGNFRPNRYRLQNIIEILQLNNDEEWLNSCGYCAPLNHKQKYLISYLEDSNGRVIQYGNVVTDKSPCDWIGETRKAMQDHFPRKFVLLNAIKISDKDYLKHKDKFE